MIYNFRHDRSRRDSIKERIIEDSQLSQGWGGGPSEANLDINQSNFVEECVRFYEPGMKSTHIPSNLCRIRDFKDGDGVIVKSSA